MDTPYTPSDDELQAWASEQVRELLQRCLRGLAQHFTALACGLDVADPEL
jgi:hypothetical protein